MRAGLFEPGPLRALALVLLALVPFGLAGGIAAPASAAIDQELGRFNGFYSLSVDGLGTASIVASIAVQKPDVDAQVRAAFLVAAGSPGRVIQDGDVSLNGVALRFDVSVLAPQVSGDDFNNVAADVGEIARAAAASQPAGPIPFEVRQVGARTLEGLVLAVVWDDPSVVEPRSIVLQLGGQAQGGESFSVPIAPPLDLSGANPVAELGLGVASSCQRGASCASGDDDATELRVNGTLLSSAAGGEDDGNPNLGAGHLVTVGGEGDDAANPVDPTAPPGPNVDDELYDLSGLLAAGATSFDVATLNPTQRANAFFVSFVGSTSAFLVDDTNDLPDALPGDGLCATAAGTCSVRAAVEEANQDPAADTVVLPAGVFDTEDGSLLVTEDLSIIGAGPGQTILDASGGASPLDLTADPGPLRVDVSDLTVTGGFANDGGGVVVGAETDALLVRVEVTDNFAANGGGIFVEGRLTLVESTVTQNSADSSGGAQGGGIAALFGAELNLLDSTISGNFAGGNGGGVLAAGQGLVVDGSVITGNSATNGARGGGLFVQTGFDSAARVLNSTIDSNSADQAGGGVFVDDSQLELRDSSVRLNTAPSGAGVFSGTTVEFGGSNLLVVGTLFESNVAAGVRTGGFGGGLVNAAGQLRVETSTFLTNQASGSGGGLFNANGATSTLVETSFTGNLASNVPNNTQGGGAANFGELEIVDSEFTGNQAGLGGAVTSGNVLVAQGSTFSANSADGGGGALFAFSGVATVRDSTFSANTTLGSGAAVFSIADVVLANVTATANQAGAGSGALDTSDGLIRLQSTIVAGNLPADCALGVTSQDFNLDGDTSCGLSGAGDVSGVDPLLGPLADNGGPTSTHALLFGSPAIDAGNPDEQSNTACDGADQRGVERFAPLTGRCDIGAFEREGVEPTLTDVFAIGAWPEALEFVELGGTPFVVAAVQDQGLFFFDVTDPNVPVAGATLVPSGDQCPEGFSFQELALEGETLWVAAGVCGVLRVDLSNALLPVLDGFDTEVFAVELAAFTLPPPASTPLIFVADHFGGLRIFDVTDPANGVELSSLLTADFGVEPAFERAVLGVEVKQRAGRVLAYVAAVDGVFIVDATDPAFPEVVGQFLTAGAGCQLEPAECVEDFSILDPVQQAELRFIPHQLHVDGNQALSPAFQGGILVFDMTPQPDGSFDLSRIQTIDTAQAFYRIENQGAVKVAAEGQCGLRVLEEGGVAFQDAELRNTPNPVPMSGFVPGLCDPDPFVSANLFVWDVVSRDGLLWVAQGLFPAAGDLDGSIQAVDLGLAPPPPPPPPFCGLLGVELLLVPWALRRARRRSPLRRG